MTAPSNERLRDRSEDEKQRLREIVNGLPAGSATAMKRWLFARLRGGSHREITFDDLRAAKSFRWASDDELFALAGAITGQKSTDTVEKEVDRMEKPQHSSKESVVTESELQLELLRVMKFGIEQQERALQAAAEKMFGDKGYNDKMGSHISYLASALPPQMNALRQLEAQADKRVPTLSTEERMSAIGEFYRSLSIEQRAELLGQLSKEGGVL